MSALCDLTPATIGLGRAELGSCLTLVSPSGMTADDRKEWIAVAMKTLSGIPADLLERGCAVARKTCRFPSEIVPTILAEVQSSWDYRTRRANEERAQFENRHAPRIEQHEPEYVKPDEAKAILASLGLKSLSGREA